MNLRDRLGRKIWIVRLYKFQEMNNIPKDFLLFISALNVSKACNYREVKILSWFNRDKSDTFCVHIIELLLTGIPLQNKGFGDMFDDLDQQSVRPGPVDFHLTHPRMPDKYRLQFPEIDTEEIGMVSDFAQFTDFGRCRHTTPLDHHIILDLEIFDP